MFFSFCSAVRNSLQDGNVSSSDDDENDSDAGSIDDRLDNDERRKLLAFITGTSRIGSVAQCCCILSVARQAWPD